MCSGFVTQRLKFLLQQSKCVEHSLNLTGSRVVIFVVRINCIFRIDRGTDAIYIYIFFS